MGKKSHTMENHKEDKGMHRQYWNVRGGLGSTASCFNGAGVGWIAWQRLLLHSQLPCFLPQPRHCYRTDFELIPPCWQEHVIALVYFSLLWTVAFGLCAYCSTWKVIYRGSMISLAAFRVPYIIIKAIFNLSFILGLQTS